MSATPSDVLNKNLFSNLGDLFSFTVTIHDPSDMWLSIWTWNLMSFGFTHFVAGLLCAVQMRGEISGRYLPLITLAYTAFGLLIAVTGGSVAAALIAAVHLYSGIAMPTTEAFGWGVGLCVLYISMSVYNNLDFL